MFNLNFENKNKNSNSESVFVTYFFVARPWETEIHQLTKFDDTDALY